MVIVFRPLVLLSCLFVLHVQALPQVNGVVQGAADINVQGDHMGVHQNSELLHVQFDHLNIGKDESVHFYQGNSAQWAVAESLSADPTSIYGSLSADAGLFVVSSNGLIVHEGGVVDAGSLAFATGHLSPEDEGRFRISMTDSLFENSGSISGGSVSIFSQHFVNTNIVQSYGDLSINGIDEVLMTFSGEAISFVATQQAANALIENHGELHANGGHVVIDAKTKHNLHELTIHNTGSIKATQVVEEGGDIYLLGGDGDIENYGLIESTASNEHEDGGTIEMSSNRIANFSTIKANAKGIGDGGNVALLADEVVTLLPESVVDVSADLIGTGGFVKAFSPDTALFSRTASIYAMGGSLFGDGGFVDVSGWQTVLAQGMVNTSAVNGSNGTYLIDPYNVTISAGASANETFASNVYTPSSSGAIINVTDLQNNLKLGNVQVVTTGAGAESGDISVSVAIDLDGTNGNTLHLLADGSIQLNGSIQDGTPGTADQTNIILETKAGSITGANPVKTGGGSLSLISNGNLTLGTGGTIDLANFDSEGGALTVESQTGSITLVSDIDLDGMNGQTLNLIASTNLALDFDVYDSATGSADAVDVFLQAKTGTLSFGVAKYAATYGGDLTIQYDTSSMDFGSGGDFASANLLSLGSGQLTLETLVGDMTVSSFVQLDGRNGSITQFTSGGTLNINADIVDSTPGTADITNIVLQASNNLTMLDGITVDSGGGTISLTASNNMSIANVITDGGNLFVTGGNDVTDAGDAGTSYDINTSGGTAFFNVVGDIGGTGWGSALEVADTHFDFTVGSNNSNIYLDAGLSTAELEIVGLDYNGGNGLNFNIRSTNGADIRVSGRMDDSDSSGDSASFNLLTQTLNGDIIIEDAGAIKSKGGTIDLSAGNSIALAEVWSGGGAITITAVNLSDSGDSGGSDINVGGGVATLNVSGDIGISFATAIDLNFGTFDINNSGSNQNHWFNALSPQDVIFRNVDFNGVGTYSFNANHSGSGDFLFAGAFADSVGSDDIANLNVQSDGSSSYLIVDNTGVINTGGGNLVFTTTGLGSNINVRDGGGVITGAGDLTLNASNDLNITNLISGGTISLTGMDINDLGDSATDIVSSGGVVNLTASGNVGGTSSVTALEITNAIVNFTAAGSNQNVFLNGVGGSDLVINNADYNGTSAFTMDVQHSGTGDIQITGAVTDSAAGSSDIATLNFSTSTGNIIAADGATIRSYGGDITYNSAAQLGIVRTKTDGGQLNITATEVYDNGNTGPDIETLGGNIVFNVVGDIGVSGNGSLELRDSVVTGSVGSNNATWDFRAYAATNYNSIGNINIDGGNGFNLALHNNNGGELRVVGNLEDSNTATADQANISLQTLSGGDQIVMSDGTLLNTYGGSITFNSAAAIGLAQLISGGGAINITSTGNIYDNNVTGSEFYSSGGVVTINAGGSIGLNATTGAIEVRDSVFDVNFSQPSQNAWFNVKASNGYMNIRDVDFNGADGSLFYVEADNGSDIIVSGQMYDSDTGVQDDGSVNLITTTGDITINDGATIRVGNGDVTLDSGNDLYFTGLLGGSVTNLVAANNMIDSGGITLDIQTTGIVNMTAGGSVGLAGADTVFDFSGGTYNMTMGAGDWDIIASGVVNLNDIEINGANGSQLKFITTSDLNLTGVMTDSVDAGDRVTLLLGASAPGFIVFPDAGYTVLGALNIWDGTSGIRDATDERIRLTADDLIISGNSFLNNTGPIIMDLSVDRLDISHTSSTIDFEINNSRDLQLLALDGDGVALSGRSFKLDVNGRLIVPSSGLRNVEDQLWIIADDLDDPDADNIVSIFDSTGDADNELNLILEINGANSIQVNTNATFLDGLLASGSDMTISASATELNLGSDLNSDGLLVSGAGTWRFVSDNLIRLADSGLASTGNYYFEVGDLLDSDGDLALVGNDIFVGLSAPSLNQYSIALNASRFDGAGMTGLSITQGSDLSFSDLDGDGALFTGVQDLTSDITGRLTLDDIGIAVSGQLDITASDVVDSDSNIVLSANQLHLDFTAPAQANYSVSGAVSQFNASITSNLQIQSSSDLEISDWRGDGSVFSGATGLDIQSAGVLTLPASGLSSTNYLWLTGDDIQDGDHNLVGLNAPQVLVDTSMRNDDLSLSGSFTEVDVSLRGAGANLLINHNQSLELNDLNGDGISLQVLDGFAALTISGGVTLNNRINLVDANSNGTVGGYLFLQYEGNALFGVGSALQLTVDGSADFGRDAGFGMGANRLFVQQTGGANTSNLMAFSNSDIQVVGGDAFFDIANGGDVADFGNINMASNASIGAINTIGEVTQAHPGYSDLALQGSLQVGDSRQIVFNGYTLNVEEPEVPETPDTPDVIDQIDQGVSDAINDSVEDGSQVVVDEIQEETVSAVESSPNVNFALNEMFSGCREGDNRDTRCKVKEEISRFLGKFLIGGSMPKTVR